MKALTITQQLIEMKNQAEQEQARATVDRQEQAQAKARQRVANGLISPIQAFNEAHPLKDYLLELGYEQHGENKFLSPFSETGVAGVNVNDDIRWVSHHSNDKAKGIGKQIENGDAQTGDSFDLFRFFECGNDYNQAVKKAGELFTTPTGRTITKQNQVNYMNAQAANDFDNFKENNFDELIHQAKLLSPDDHEQMNDLLSQAAQLSPLHRERLIQQITQSTGIKKNALNAMLKAELSKPDHLSLALAFIESNGRENLTADINGLYQWNEDAGLWIKLEHPKAKQLIQTFIANQSNVTKGSVASVFDLVLNELYEPNLAFNTRKADAVTFTNGTLEYNDQACLWEMHPHNREHFNTIGLNIIYDPSATAPKFEQFMAQIFAGDADATDKKQAILEMMGYSLMTHTRHERFVMLHGNGSNGKSVLLKIIEGLCGRQYVTAIQPNQMDKTSQRAQLENKLVNIVTEISAGMKLDDGAIKAIASGEPVTVSHKWEHEFLLYSFATCWFATNTLPHVKDLSDGTERRTLIIQLNNKFEGKDKNPRLAEQILADEKAGIIKLALDAYGKVTKLSNFTNPESAQKAADKWFDEANQVALFLQSEDVELDETAKTHFKELYQAFRRWADSVGINRILTEKTFSERLEGKGFIKVRANIGMVYIGLKPVLHDEGF